MTWRIVSTATMGPHEAVLERLKTAGCQLDLLPADATCWTPSLIERFAPNADAYVGTFRSIGLPRDVLAASRRARVVTSPIIGVEFIDVAAASDAGILVAHGAMPQNFDGMAEAGVMLVAALRKRLQEKCASMAAGEWKRVAAAGHLVSGATVGLLGFGRIGRGVAARLAGWSCDIVAHDPYVDPAPARALGVTMVGFDALLARADVLLVLVPLTDETKHMIDAAALRRMRPGSALINIGRGGCVDENALLAALGDGHIAAAAIDTWEDEPPPADHPLRRHPQVIATSHDVGHSAELYAAIPLVAERNTLAALRGELPDYIRNPEAVALWQSRVAAMAELA
jgi:D-3-phosphoglycerate dehydrogenase / 2-oxoglutarate reductase